MRALAVVAVLLLAALGSAASAQDARDRFLAQCRADTLAQWPDAVDRVNVRCAERWPSVARSNPLVDVLLSPFADDSPPPVTLGELRDRAAMVRWGPATPQGTEGRFGGVDVQIPAAGPLRLVVGWAAVGEPVPYEIVDALRLRGASVELVGCYDYGATESNSVYRVAAPGHAAFAMTLYRREAPTTGAHSHLTVTADAAGPIPTMDSLRRSEPAAEWKTRCA
jgi:hypothetical protein